MGLGADRISSTFFNIKSDFWLGWRCNVDSGITQTNGGLVTNNNSFFAGNVGIGTASPGSKLVVRTSTDHNFEVEETGGELRLSALNDARSANIGLQFAASEFNFITGNVGIGTTSPGTYLQIGDYPSNNIDITTYPDVPSEHMIHLSAPETSGRYGGGISFGEDTFTAANIVVRDAGGLGALDLCFGTGNTYGVTERMRITSGGDVLVAKQSAGLGVVGTELRANGQSLFTCDGDSPINMNRLTSDGVLAYFRKDSTIRGSIYVNNFGTTYNTSSDYRLKEDLQDFAGLNMVSKIPVYDFKWKAAESRSYGVMAHELQEVLPDAVTGEKDAEEMQGVDYSKIVPLLVKSIQELKAEIELLKTQINN